MSTIIEVTGVACDTPRQCAWRAAELAADALAHANRAGADIVSAPAPASPGVLWTQTLTTPGCEPVRLGYGRDLAAVAIDRPDCPVAHATIYIVAVEILHAWQRAGLIETFADILQWRFHKRDVDSFMVGLYEHRGEPLGLRRPSANCRLEFKERYGFAPTPDDLMSADEVYLPERGLYLDHARYANLRAVMAADEYLSSFL